MSERDLWETERAGVLFDLEFDPAYIDQMGHLSHYNRLPLICTWYSGDALSPNDLARLLSDWWTHGGYAHHLGWEAEDWVAMFRYADRFITDTPGVTEPTEPLTIWRGGVPGASRGLSWSTDRAVGEFFAKRNVWKIGRAELWQATIHPYHVLGIFHERNEAEVEIDPAGLSGLATIALYTGEPVDGEDREWMELD